LRALLAVHRYERFRATFEPEPDNPHDPNAVRLVAAESTETIGYLPSDDASVAKQAGLARGLVVDCSAILTGGTDDRPLLGVVVVSRAMHNILEQFAIARHRQVEAAQPKAVDQRPSASVPAPAVPLFAEPGTSSVPARVSPLATVAVVLCGALLLIALLVWAWG
jgi:hypothetical protein